MKLENLEDLLEEQVKDLFSAENQLLKLLPKMMRRASTPTLASAIEAHISETELHVDRLKSVGEKLGIKIAGKKCRAMEGILAEAKEVVNAKGEDCAVDAALIAAGQRVEHYEMSAYGTARAIAMQLGYEDVVRLLQQSLEEESAADERLSQISLDEVLPSCVESDEDSDAPARDGDRIRQYSDGR